MSFIVMSVFIGLSMLAGCGNNNENYKTTIGEINKQVTNENNEQINQNKKVATEKNEQAEKPKQNSLQNEEPSEEPTEEIYIPSPIRGCEVVGKINGSNTYRLQSKCEGCGHLGAITFTMICTDSRTGAKMNFTCNQTDCQLKGKVQYAQAECICIN